MAGTILAAVLGGAVKGVAATATKSALAPLVTKLQTAILGAPPTVWDQAVKAALAKAVRLVEESADLGSEPVRRRVAVLLSYQEAAEEISRAALFGEKCDLDRLGVIYRRIAAADEATVSEDEALQAELALEPCLDLVAQELKRDSAVGGMIALARQIASAERLESSAILTQELLTKIEQSLGRTSAATEAAAETLRQVEGNTRNAAETQQAILAESQRGRPVGLDPTEAEKEYLRWLLDQCDDVPLMGEKRALPGEGVTSQPTSLRRVYVGLATTKPASWELVCDRLGLSTPQQAKLEAALRQLSDAQGQPEPHIRASEFGAGELDVRLAAMARLDDQLLKKNGELRNLVKDAQTAQHALEPWGSWEAWQERLRLPGTLVLFDGLDEVRGHEGPREAEDTSLRQRLARAIRDFATTYDRVRVVVTCRVRPYERAGRDYYFPKLEKVKLAPLDETRIERFCRRWYAEMRRIVLCSQDDEAERLTSQLLAALGDERRKRLREMAETPLLLTMLAKVNLKYPLPEGRLALYELCVKQLLWEWEILRSGETGKKESLDQLLEQAPIPQSRENLEKKLWKLAYEVHDSTPDGVADLTGTVLRAAVAGSAPPTVTAEQQETWDAWARRLVTFLSRRDGLLVYLGDDVFTFPHRTFQEYLAARWMRQDSARRDVLLKMAGREGWDEAVRLACLQLASESRGDGLDLLRFLADNSRSAPSSSEGVRRALVWGQAALDLKLDEVEALEDSDAKTKTAILGVFDHRLTQLLQDSNLPAAQRLEAGEILADLGIVPPDLGELVEIPDRGLGYSFQIGKYPVTNFEYRKFVEAGGYERNQPWWSEEAKKEIESWREWPSAPVYWQDPKWNRDTFPVVGISWYEALAYCAWLEEQWR